MFGCTCHCYVENVTEFVEGLLKSNVAEVIFEKILKHIDV